MAEKIELGIVVDTDTRATRQEFSALRRDIKREAEGMGDDWEAAAQKVEDALREAGARDDLIDAARRIGREGPSEIEKMQRALRDVDDTARSTADAVDEAARDISDSFEENALTPEDVFGAEMKAEILSNAAESGAEVARGFKDGFDSEDVETILDGVTDTIVSVGAAGGPLGVAAGLAGATAIQAFAGPFIEGAKERAEEFETTFSNAFDAIVQDGTAAGRELAIGMNSDAIVQDTEKLAEATERAAQLGIGLGPVLRAMAGDTDAYGIVQQAVTAKTDALNAELERQREAYLNGKITVDEWNAAQDENATKLEELTPRVDGVTSSYENNAKALDAAQEAARAKAESDAYAAQKATEQALATAAATQQAKDFEVTIDGATKTLRAMPDGKVVEVTDNGTADLTQQTIDAIHGTTVTAEVVFDRDRILAGMQTAVDIAASLVRKPVVEFTPRVGSTAV